MSISKTSKQKSLKNIVRMVEILKDAIIKKDIDEKVYAYENQLRSKYMKLIN